MVKDKLFREDLFYRLNVVPINIPPLRDRRDDILPLIKYVLNDINRKYGFDKSMTSEVITTLIKYDWPGNVRQLENYIEGVLVSTSDNIINMDNLNTEMLTIKYKKDHLDIDLNTKSYKEIVAEYEKDVLNHIIKQEGSVAKAADKIKINESTIRRKLNKVKK